MSNEKKIQLTRLQGIIAIASFSAGVLIACVCLFFIEPLGQIDTSGVKASYDVKFRKFQAELDQVIENEKQHTN